MPALLLHLTMQEVHDGAQQAGLVCMCGKAGKGARCARATRQASCAMWLRPRGVGHVRVLRSVLTLSPNSPVLFVMMKCVQSGLWWWRGACTRLPGSGARSPRCCWLSLHTRESPSRSSVNSVPRGGDLVLGGRPGCSW